MILIGLLLLVGLFLSAFFSGSETGFYRVTRLRLVIDALAGDLPSRGLLWLSNRPTLFIATTLVGNNLANYLTSLAAVMASQYLFPTGGTTVDLLGPIIMAPIVFILGELLPKNLFHAAPNRLLRRSALPLFGFGILFAPLTFLLWVFSRLVRLMTNASPQEVRLSLARRELAEMLSEGHEVGLLRPVQQALAQAMLSVASQPIKNFSSPTIRVVRVTTTMSKSNVLRIAQQNNRTLLPVEDPRQKRKLIGYMRTVDLYLDDSTALPEIRPLVTLSENDKFLTALKKMSQAEDALGHIVDEAGRTIGFVTGRELRATMLRVG
ncbi:MAG: CNNM domain-containing protein [Pirellulales bacterium]